MMRRTSWIWLVGCIAWAVSCLFSLHNHDLPHAQLSGFVAIMFGIAFAFYRQQKR